MKRILFLFIALFICVSSGYSQVHFQKVWSGNGLDQMNFNVMSATIDGTDLQVGDEVAIFDATYCVGVLTVTSPSSILYIIASKDDPTTSGTVDGYRVGNTATVKIWDASASKEVTDISIGLVSGTMAFDVSATTWLNLTAISCPLPAQPGTITGSSPVCQGSSQTYSIGSVSGADSYTWTLPPGWSGSSTSTSITATPGAAGGTISVSANNSCGPGIARTKDITVNIIPAQPGTITGNATVCQGSSQTYSIDDVTGAESYTWTLPSGWTGSSTSTSITVTPSSTSGNVSVRANSSTCGNSAVKSLSVTVTPTPAQPSTITGNNNPCQGATGVTYSVTNVAGVTYTWAVPSGWSVTSGQGTNAIGVTVGSSAGNVAVTPSNSCGNGTARTLAVTTSTIPSQPGTITGNNNPCQGATGITYSVTNVSGVTFTWAVPSGWSITSGQGTNAIIVTVGANAGDITVTPSNTCGNGTARTSGVTVNALPGQPTTITGNNNPCQAATGLAYSVTNVAGVTFTWVVPSGWSITSGQGTNAIGVTVGANSGNVTVTPSNSCGNGTERTLAVTVNPLPGQPTTISGNGNPCQGTTGVTYSVTNVAGVTYTWTVPSGWSITSGQGTNSIGVTAGSNAGNVIVTPSNTCGNGTARTLAVTTSTIPSQPGTITGNNNPCQGAAGVTYSVTNVSGVTFTWAVPSGWSITSGQGTNSINVTVGANAGDISVTPSNACGNGTARTFGVTVNTLPGQPTTITGNNNPCQGATGLAYSVNNVAGVTYTWAVPSGWSITSGQNSNEISVTVGANSGNVTVTPSNSCGNGTERTLAVTVNPLPGQPTTISGNNNPCQGTTGVTYSVTNVAGVTYTWTVPSGWSITSGQGTNAIGVTAGSNAGNVIVTPSNTCGNGTARTLAVTANTIPSQPGTITGNNNPCQGATGLTYSVTNVAGVTYTWTVPSGWSITSGQGTNSIGVTVGSGPGNVSVTPSNTCGDGTVRTLGVTVNTVPEQPGTINGAVSVCQGSSQTYSITGVAGATSYTWTIPSGWSGSSSTTSITVTAGTTGGTISVAAENSCGSGSANSINVSVQAIPGAPVTSLSQPTCSTATGTITITSPMGSGMTYSINGSTYTNTSGIFTSVVSGTYTVTARNSAGCTSSGSGAVIIVQPATPATPVITLNGSILRSNATAGNQWYNASGLISGATGQDYTPTADGNYYVIVSNGVCSSNPSNTINVVLTGIEQFDFNKSLYLYPNPTDGKVTLVNKGENQGKMTIEILNIIGQSVKIIRIEVPENQNEINMEGLPKGIYYIKISSAKNSVTKRIILQ